MLFVYFHCDLCLKKDLTSMNYPSYFTIKYKGKTIPGQGLMVPGEWGYQISWHSAHEGSKIISPKHRPPLPQEIFLVLISFRGWANPMFISRPEALCQRIIPMTPSGIEPATFRLVAQCHNQLRYRGWRLWTGSRYVVSATAAIWLLGVVPRLRKEVCRV
jgi:hypothetical protein